MVVSIIQTQAITLTLLFRPLGAVSASSSHVSGVMIYVQSSGLGTLVPLL